MSPVCAIKAFNLSFSVFPPLFEPNQTPIQIQEALPMLSVSNLLTKQDNYTPNDDYHWLWQSISTAAAPNFIFIQSPNQLNLSVQLASGVFIVNAMPISKVGIFLFPSGVLPVNIYLEGRVAESPNPMPQGVAAPYYCVMAQAAL